MTRSFASKHAQAFAWNRAAWDERVPVHWKSNMYRRHADILRSGGHGLDENIVCDIGDIKDKSLIHLQCHMGMETLAWARLGAQVLGVDFSEPAIEKAEQLRDELGMPARFLCANVYDVCDLIDETFDIVFVSIGSLCWLPDITQWAAVVAAMLKPNGMLYLNEVHPMFSTLENTDNDPGFAIQYPYLDGEPIILDDDRTYADTSQTFQCRKMAEWIHPMGEIINALIQAGLRIDCLEESATCVWPALKVMTTADGHRWHMPEPWRGKIPVSFVLIAHRHSL